MRGRTKFLGLLIGLLAARNGAAAVTAAPGYALRSIPTPDVVQGGVVTRGGAILVGVGSFGAGGESILRLDGGATTTIATGFGSLGGFDLDAAGTLYVVDNCFTGDFGCSGATTGDTLYAIPDALTRTTAIAADDAEVLPAGSIPAAFDVLVGPTSLLVSDAAGNGAGRVIEVVGGTATDLITDLNLTAGLAQQGSTLLVTDAVLNMDFTTTGAVYEYGFDGTLDHARVTGLVGGSGAAVDAAGNVLVSGIGSFGATSVIAVAANGTTTDRATGFGFSGDLFYDAARDETLVLDFGVSEITAICRDQDDDGVCDAADDCPMAADPAQLDTDGDGLGDACDPCASGAALAQAKVIVVKLATPPGDDVLTVKGTVTAAGADPTTTGLRLTIDDSAGGVVEALLPPGAFDPGTGTGWKSRHGTFHTTADLGGALGTVKATVKADKPSPGLAKVVLVGKHGSYPGSPAHLPLQATLALGAGACGESAFAAPDCSYNPAKGKVLCR